LDDECIDFKKIKSKNELLRITREFNKKWDKKYIPELRHIITIRNYIRDNGNFVKHTKLVEFICDNFGYNKHDANLMLDYMVENDVISQLYWSNNTDLRYLVSEE